MLKSLLFVFSICALVPVFNAGCQNVNVVPEVEISEAVLNTAKTFDFKYMEVLTKAKTGDVQSIFDFLHFHKYVDGIEGLSHGVTCLELIPYATDAKFSLACVMAKPALRKVVADRLASAQGNTKKEALRKPLKEWAPMTWAALNNVATAGSDLKISDPSQQNMKKPGTENQPAPPVKPASDADAKPDGGGK
jgi:hypothetical protein